MSILSLFNRNRRKKSYTFSDDDRELASMVRKEKAELKQQEIQIKRLELEKRKLEREAEIEDLKAELYGTDDDDDDNNNKPQSIENMLMLSLLQGFNKNSTNQEQTPNIQPLQQDNLPIELTDEEIKQQIDSMPKHLIKLGKKMPTENLIKFIKSQGNFTDNTIQKAVSIVKS